MKHMAVALMLLCALSLVTSQARANEDKWLLGLDFGMVRTLEQQDRADAGAIFGLAVGRSFALNPKLEISVQAQFAFLPGIGLQVPVTARWWPDDTGLTLHASVRPGFFAVVVCANDTDKCPLDDALEPAERGGGALGVLGGLGLGYAQGRLYGEASYLAGWAQGLDQDDGGEVARTGFYNGILFSGGVRL